MSNDTQQLNFLQEDIIPIKQRDQPDFYLPDDGLLAAIRVALLLQRPLLVTGEPGCGKTQLATYLAHQLNAGEPLRFDTKSSSTARDLFYLYDAIGHFHATKTQQERTKENGCGNAVTAFDYIEPSALGLAILRSKNKEELKEKQLLPLLQRNYENFTPPCRSVVLIDEIDKASRDFPNDILNEVENGSFYIRELDLKIDADQNFAPVLIFTSNSEKHLPDAFLRRCVYYNIPFPDDRIDQIVNGHLEQFVEHYRPQYQEAINFFRMLRDPSKGLRKPPATAELIDWLLVLRETGDFKKALAEQKTEMLQSLVCLVKCAEDQLVAEQLLEKTATNINRSS